MMKKNTKHKKQKPMLLGLSKKSTKDSIECTQNATKQNLLQGSHAPLQPIASVAIMGRPNVGKSSLFNRLNQKNIAITSHISGSTRDINKRDLRLHHFDITLIDTGGLEVVAHKLKAFYKENEKGFQTKQDSTPTEKGADLHSQNLSNPHKQALIAAQLKESIALHSYSVVATSDIIVYVVDGSSVATDEDIKIFRELSKKKPTLLVLNKVDNDKIAWQASEFMAFGAPYITISVAHNRGITQLLSQIESLIETLLTSKKLIKPPPKQPKELDFMDYFDENESIITFEDNENLDIENKNNTLDSIPPHYNIAVGIIGRPNVGKSSLLNALTNTERALVSDIAGTTIDPVDEKITYNNHTLTFIDTAGIRRRSKIEGIEKYALDRTQKMLQQCDIALLVFDCSADFVELDEKISALASNNELGVIVVFHKWDIRNKEFAVRLAAYKHKFKFLEYAPVITASSITKKHIKELKQKIIEVYEYFQYRIPTAKLNTCIQNAIKKHPIPSDHGKLVKVYYATQFDSKPPKVALIMNRPNALHFSYKRYLVNTLRKEFDFSGTPIIIEARSKKTKENDE